MFIQDQGSIIIAIQSWVGRICDTTFQYIAYPTIIYWTRVHILRSSNQLHILHYIEVCCILSSQERSCWLGAAFERIGRPTLRWTPLQMWQTIKINYISHILLPLLSNIAWTSVDCDYIADRVQSSTILQVRHSIGLHVTETIIVSIMILDHTAVLNHTPRMTLN
jgi:hypothetical protein